MKNRIFISLLLLFVGAFQGYSQDENFPSPLDNKVIPPSPEAAELGKYGDIPVSLNTGTPNISIPIYQISEGSVNLPINLSYHASGIKVEQFATWVGLGWSLNAGGVITRSVRGKPDEEVDGYFSNAHNLERLLYHQMNDQEEESFNFLAASGKLDLQPDLFYFNFGQYSGKIVFDKNKEPHIIPHQNLEITLNDLGVNPTWSIRDPNGNRYEFKYTDAEYTASVSSFYSAWYLSKIYTVNNDIIEFTYGTGLESEFTFNNSETVILNGPGSSNCTHDPPVGGGGSSDDIQISKKYLTEITFRGGKLKFNSSTNREDVDVDFKGRKLENIELIKGQNQVVKTFTLTHGYFNNGSVKRMRLDSFKANNDSAYTFEYNDIALPLQNSKDKDHWGYFNDANNSTMIPELSPEIAANFSNSSFASGDRKTNTVKGLASILTKIKYPTGGHTKFEYEVNDFYGTEINERSLISIVHGSDLTTDMDSRETSFSNYYFDNIISDAGLDDPPLVNIVHKSFPSGMNGSFSTTWSTDDGKPVPLPHVQETRVYRTDNIFQSFNDYTPICTNCGGVANLAPGEYYFVTIATHPNSSAKLIFNFDEKTEKNINVGGARIKKMVDHDGIDAGNNIVRKYYYTKDGTDDFNAESSGKLFYKPEYKKNTPCGNMVVTSYDNNHLGRSEGSHIGYSMVTVDHGYGKTVHKFVNTAKDWTRALEKETVMLSESGDTVQKIQNVYTLYDNRAGGNVLGGNISFSKVENFTTTISVGGQTQSINNSIYHYLDEYKWHNSEWFHLDTVKSFIYDQENENFHLESLSANHYGNPFHLNPTYTVQYLNNGQKIETTIQYAADTTGTTFGSNHLRDKYIHNQPVTQLVKIGSALGKSENYFTLNNNKVVLEKLVQYPQGKSEGKKTFEMKYDPYGNLREIRRKDGTPVTYIWGYNHKFPVAKIEGATYQEVETKLGANFGDNLAGYGLSAVQEGNLRDEFKHAMVYTYEYDTIFGMLSARDPGGKKMTYEYDADGRLKLIKDHQDNIRQSYEYKIQQP